MSKISKIIPKGKPYWVKSFDGNLNTCSVCGCTDVVPWHYCPRCNSEMYNGNDLYIKTSEIEEMLKNAKK